MIKEAFLEPSEMTSQPSWISLHRFSSNRVVLQRVANLNLIFSRANNGGLVQVFYQPPRSKSRRVLYRRIPKVAAPVTFGFSRPKGPLLSGGRYFRVAVTFGWLRNVCNLFRHSVYTCYSLPT